MKTLAQYTQPILDLTKYNLFKVLLGVNIGYFGWKYLNKYTENLHTFHFCPFILWKRYN